MFECPECEEQFDTRTSVKRHVPPAHDWSLTDSRHDYLDEELDDKDGLYVAIVTWDEQNGGTEVIEGTLQRQRLASELTDDNGDTWTIQWLGGRTPGGYYVHEPDPETDRLGMPDPSRRVVDVRA